MSIRNASTFLKSLRLAMNQSQEEFCFGICTPTSISRMENGKAGIRPSTLKKFMMRAGVPGIYFPAFKNRNEFEIFHALEQALFYIDYWDLEHAYPLLAQAEEANYCGNLSLYQRGTLGTSLFLMRSGNCDYEQIADWLEDAMWVTMNTDDLTYFGRRMLSLTDLQLIIAWCQCILHTKKSAQALPLLRKLADYLPTASMTYNERCMLQTKAAAVLAEALYQEGLYSDAVQVASDGRALSVRSVEHAALHELALWEALSLDRIGDHERADKLIEDCYLSARSCGNMFAATVKRLAIHVMTISNSAFMFSFVDPPQKHWSFDHKMLCSSDNSFVREQSYDYSYLFGDIIRDRRIGHGYTQDQLAAGLCNRSTLAKIENNTLWPDKWLADALLQRLGIYSEMFAMYGSAEEVRIDDLRRRILAHSIQSEFDTVKELLQEFQETADMGNKLHRQYYYLLYAGTLRTKDETYLHYLQTAWNCTVPASPEIEIGINPLSRDELNLVLRTAIYHTKNGRDTTALQILECIQEYYTSHVFDSREKMGNYALVMYWYIRGLYNLNLLSQLESLRIETDVIPSIHHYFMHSLIYFYTSQAFGKMNFPTTDIIRHGKYACATFSLINRSSTDALLRNFLLNDFKIVLP